MCKSKRATALVELYCHYEWLHRYVGVRPRELQEQDMVNILIQRAISDGVTNQEEIDCEIKTIMDEAEQAFLKNHSE